MGGDGVVGVVNGKDGGERRPVVAVEDTAAEEVEEPGPVGVTVVVGGDVKAEPAATVGHVVLECGALFWRVGEVVEPEDELVVGEIGGVEVVPVGGGGEFEVVALCGGGEEVKRLVGEIDVIVLNGLRVEGEDARNGLLLCRGREGEQREEEENEEFGHGCVVRKERFSEAVIILDNRSSKGL